MCATCGCSSSEPVTISNIEKQTLVSVTAGDANHAHGHQNHHHHTHHEHDESTPHFHDSDGKVITLEQAVLAKNDRYAALNREWLDGRQVLALNIVSSPGAGKTTLLEKTIQKITNIPVAVIEGDQASSNDAERIKLAGAKTVQINTGTGCHLDAIMVGQAMKELNPVTGSLLFIENVGNLVCPAMFDLGEKMKVAIVSVTEGEDKPIKYPHMFRACNLVVINKIDLVPHIDFNLELLKQNIITINPQAKILVTSAYKNNIDEWMSFLTTQQEKV